MRRKVVLVLAVLCVLAPSTVRSRGRHGAGARRYAEVTGRRNEIERAHGRFVIVDGIRIYRPGQHNILQATPDWIVRDASELLDRVRRKRG